MNAPQPMQPREIAVAAPGDPLLGPFADLPGTWKGEGTGWNMIALPFLSDAEGPLDYRLLLNQFDEQLTFSLVDKRVANRGIDEATDTQTDQFVTALDYEQLVSQVAVEDRPASAVAGLPGAAIHHEPGLFLNMLDQVEDGEPTIARLATIPHGDAALALGTSFPFPGPPQIAAVNGLPVGVSQNLEKNPYLEPYKHFHDNPFFGNVPAGTPGFPGFDPTQPHLLLRLANQIQPVTSTTVLQLDTATATGGIRNIPFVVKQADAVRMTATFWINKLAQTGPDGAPLLQLQYIQTVFLHFFPRRDGRPGRITWPHISINTLMKVSDEPLANADLTSQKMEEDLTAPHIAALRNAGEPK